MTADTSLLQTAGDELAAASRQVWDSVWQWLGRGDGSIELTLMFTELCGFSSWVLKVGDERALELLREVAKVVEPCITAHRGKLVKRLGHGHMAVFPEADDAVGAALAMQAELSDLHGAAPRRRLRADPQPRLRAGLHRGNPQRLDGDYLGTDVNIAARIAEAARAGEVLMSGEVLASIGVQQRERLEVKRRRAFRAKGAPPGLEVYSVTTQA
jgi:adenylate cyclase